MRKRTGGHLLQIDRRVILGEIGIGILVDADPSAGWLAAPEVKFERDVTLIRSNSSDDNRRFESKLQNTHKIPEFPVRDGVGWNSLSVSATADRLCCLVHEMCVSSPRSSNLECSKASKVTVQSVHPFPTRTQIRFSPRARVARPACGTPEAVAVRRL